MTGNFLKPNAAEGRGRIKLGVLAFSGQFVVDDPVECILLLSTRRCNAVYEEVWRPGNSELPAFFKILGYISFVFAIREARTELLLIKFQFARILDQRIFIEITCDSAQLPWKIERV